MSAYQLPAWLLMHGCSGEHFHSLVLHCLSSAYHGIAVWRSVIHLLGVTGFVHCTYSGIEIENAIYLKRVEPSFSKLSGFLVIFICGPGAKITKILRNFEGRVRKNFFNQPYVPILVSGLKFFWPLEFQGTHFHCEFHGPWGFNHRNKKIVFQKSSQTQF